MNINQNFTKSVMSIMLCIVGTSIQSCWMASKTSCLLKEDIQSTLFHRGFTFWNDSTLVGATGRFSDLFVDSLLMCRVDRNKYTLLFKVKETTNNTILDNSKAILAKLSPITSSINDLFFAIKEPIYAEDSEKELRFEYEYQPDLYIIVYHDSFRVKVYTLDSLMTNSK